MTEDAFGEGHVQLGNAALRVIHPELWLEIVRRDGEGEPTFGPLDKRQLRALDLLVLVPELPRLAWRQATTLPGLPEACRAESEQYVITVTAASEDMTWERALERLQADLATAPTRRAPRRLGMAGD